MPKRSVSNPARLGGAAPIPAEADAHVGEGEGFGEVEAVGAKGEVLQWQVVEHAGAQRGEAAAEAIALEIQPLEL